MSSDIRIKRLHKQGHHPAPKLLRGCSSPARQRGLHGLGHEQASKCYFCVLSGGDVCSETSQTKR